jgi:FkbM family methyltransferase
MQPTTPTTPANAKPETRPLPLAARLALPYIRNEMPGWGRVYKALFPDYEHHPFPVQVVRGKWHGLLMELDLSDPMERFTYFLGRYYDAHTQLFMRKYLKRGDNFVDVGANIGMISLLASYLVGENGTVRSFEPNPACADRIEALVRLNDLHNLTLIRKAIADAPGRLELKVPSHTGMGTLVEIPTDLADAYRDSYFVEVVRGDEVLAGDTPIQMMKVDVEGFECKVLAGCAETIRRWQPCIITEVVAEYLRRAGSTPEAMFSLMRGLGYEGFEMLVHRRFARNVLALEPIKDETTPHSEDVLWVVPGSAMATRIGV